jgi:hypothetical protein
VLASSSSERHRESLHTSNPYLSFCWRYGTLSPDVLTSGMGDYPCPKGYGVQGIALRQHRLQEGRLFHTVAKHFRIMDFVQVKQQGSTVGTRRFSTPSNPTDWPEHETDAFPRNSLAAVTEAAL